MMTREELDAALLRFGSDLDRWPREDAEAARRLIAGDPSAAAMLAEFAAFEQTLADAVRTPPFGAAEIGGVLARLDATEETWRPTSWFWIAGASGSVLSLALGAAAMLAELSSYGVLDVPLSLAGLAIGRGDLGGLL